MSQEFSKFPCGIFSGVSISLKVFRQLFFLVIALLVFLIVSPAWANVKQIKAYKEAYPDEKPKCACCHVDKKPSKEEGKHEPNDYGKKVIALSKAPTADNYKEAGKAPEPED